MKKSFDEIRAAFSQNNQGNSGGDRVNNYYPFWNMQIGEQAVIRFLPDKNDENPLGFLVEKFYHNLDINGERKSVPCLKTYGETGCPICSTSSAYYKEEDEVNGKKYWRKLQHIAQAIVIEDPLPANKETGETHQDQVRFLSLGWQLYGIIKEAFESGDLDNFPYAYKDGYDFIIKKTQQGQYASYSLGSKFARHASTLTAEQIEFAEDNTVDLSTLLPQRPEMATLNSMLEADMTGSDFASDTPSTPAVPAAAKSTSAKVDPAPAASGETDGDYDEEADAILAKIRARKSA